MRAFETRRTALAVSCGRTTAFHDDASDCMLTMPASNALVAALSLPRLATQASSTRSTKVS